MRFVWGCSQCFEIHSVQAEEKDLTGKKCERTNRFGLPVCEAPLEIVGRYRTAAGAQNWMQNWMRRIGPVEGSKVASNLQPYVLVFSSAR